MKKIAVLFLMTISLIAGEKMYTQVGMWGHEETSSMRKGQTVYTDIDTYNKSKGRVIKKSFSASFTILGTNFSRGLFIPVNSKVYLIGYKKNRTLFKFKDKFIAIYNKEKYTKLDKKEFIHRQFDSKKVNLSEFNAKDKESILQGRVRVGMSKKAVLLTRGYPPAHKTPSLKSDRWQYWEESSHSHYYYFVDGKFDGKD